MALPDKSSYTPWLARSDAVSTPRRAGVGWAMATQLDRRLRLTLSKMLGGGATTERLNTTDRTRPNADRCCAHRLAARRHPDDRRGGHLRPGHGRRLRCRQRRLRQT